MTRDGRQNFRSFDGTRISYSDEGEGPAVVLLHGLAADSRMFGPLDSLRAELSAIETSIAELGVEAKPNVPAEGRRGLSARLREIGARVIVPDLRGHGASGKPHDPEAYAHSAMARDVIALIDHLRLDTVALLGYSLGAITACKLLALQPTSVASAILGGIGKEVLEGETLDLPETHPAARLAKPVTMRAYLDFIADMLMAGNTDPKTPGASYLVMARAMGNDVAALAAALRGNGAERVSGAALHAVRIPVLLLNGRNDPANLATRPLLAALPNAHAVTCEGDHLSAPWQPSFQEAVIAFLTEQWRAGPRG